VLMVIAGVTVLGVVCKASLSNCSRSESETLPVAGLSFVDADAVTTGHLLEKKKHKSQPFKGGRKSK